MHKKADTLIVGRENGRGQHSHGQACAIEWRLVTMVLGQRPLWPDNADSRARQLAVRSDAVQDTGVKRHTTASCFATYLLPHRMGQRRVRSTRGVDRERLRRAFGKRSRKRQRRQQQNPRQERECQKPGAGSLPKVV